MAIYMVFDIGGTAIKYGLVDGNGEFIKKSSVPTRAELGKDHIISTVKEIIYTNREKEVLSGIAISTAGMVDIKKGEVFYAGETMPGYSHTPWKEILEETFSLPCEVENDVNCAALAEVTKGAATDSAVTLCLTVGTGIGASFLVQKAIYRGVGYSAMSVGYMNMEESNFQNLASVNSLCERVAVGKKGERSEWDGRRVFSLAEAGDAVCIREIQYTMDQLAKGIANLCYVLNPDCVVLGGGIMERGDYIRPLLESSLKKYLRPVLFDALRLSFASFGNDAGMYGAYLHFLAQQEKMGDKREMEIEERNQ